MYKAAIKALALSAVFSFNTLAEKFDESHFDSMVQELNQQAETSTLAEIHEGYVYSLKQHNTDTIKPFGPASPLFYLEIKYVASEEYPYWESIPDNAFATRENHGGSWTYVVTIEGGYATPASRRMVFNGSTLSLVRSQPLVNSANVIIGFRNYWVTNHTTTGGTARYQATSINSPWNTENDNLRIR